jgi:hypothetical protein
MQHWQLPYLGLCDLLADLTDFEIGYFFHFPAEEHQAIASPYGNPHCFAAAIHLGFRPLADRQQRVLVTLLRREAHKAGTLESI